MNSYQNTSIYQYTLALSDQIEQLLPGLHDSLILEKFHHGLLDLLLVLASALRHENKHDINTALQPIQTHIEHLSHLIELASYKKNISASTADQIIDLLQELALKIKTFPTRRKNILILSSVLGQGHMSASKAIKQGLEYLYGKDYNITIIDFYEKIGPLLNKATVKAYEGSTKHVPAMYKAFFESTDAKWPVQLLNIINYPLNGPKIEKLFLSENPHIIISAFPVWDYLASLIIKKLGSIKFLSVVTDSISIHNAWVTGDPSTHIVANEETAISLKKLGAPAEKIKILGFPVKLEFSTPSHRETFLQELNLDPNKYTIVMQPAAEKVKHTIKIVQEIEQQFPDLNLIVICGRNKTLLPKLQAFDNHGNTRIIGWTDQMPEYIKSADMIISKAGGATVMECIAAQKPMIITQVIPGQEIGNAELIKLHELGIIQKDAKMHITECIDYIRKNQSRIQQNLARVSTPDANLRIARFIHELL